MIDVNEIYCGDCVEVMKQIPDNYIDLTVTSPPYDNLRTYKGFTWNFENTAQELWRVTKQGGVVVWVVGDATIKGSETGTSFKQSLYFMEIGFNLHDTMIFHKSNQMPLNHNRYDPCFEYMFIFSKGKPKAFNPIKEPCKHVGTIKKRYLENKANLEKNSCSRQRDEETRVKPLKIRKNIWSYPVGIEAEKETGKHTAIFPKQLVLDHIISWSNSGDIVLDPMCGSGTTCKAVKQLNRNYIGIDISPDYVKLAKKRIKLIS